MRGIDPGDYRFPSRLCRSCTYMEEFGTGDEALSDPGAADLPESHPISDQPVGMGFPHRAGRYRPGGSPFSLPE